MSLKLDMDFYTELLAIIQADENVKVREHDFGLASYGNWYIEYEKNKNGFKIRWDGKFGVLTHQLETQEVWLNQNLFRDLQSWGREKVPSPGDLWGALRH